MPDFLNVVYLISADSVDITDHLLAVATRLSPRFRLCVAARLSQYVRRRLSQREIRWVNLPMPAAADRRGHYKLAAQLSRVISSYQAHVVHSHDISAQVCSALATQRTATAPALVCSLYSAIPRGPSPDGPGWPMRRLQRRALQNADAVVVPSQAERDALCETTPNLADRTQVIYQGVERRLWTSASDPGIKRRAVGLDPQAALVGTISPLRAGLGLEDFIQAAVAVQDELPNVEFVVIGDGPHREALEELAHSLGVAGGMVFLGQRVDVGDIVPILNVLVLTTDAAAGPLRGLQALAADVAVVAADVGGLREVFEKLPRTGIFQPGNVEQLADAIRQQLEVAPPQTMAEAATTGATGMTLSREDMLASEDLYNLDTRGLEPELPQSAAARTAAEAVQERFSIDAMIAQIEQLYQRLVSEK